jgi:hypothetical protein
MSDYVGLELQAHLAAGGFHGSRANCCPLAQGVFAEAAKTSPVDRTATRYRVAFCNERYINRIPGIPYRIPKQYRLGFVFVGLDVCPASWIMCTKKVF